MIRKLPLIALFLMASIPAMAASLLVNPADSYVSVDVRANPPHSFTCDLGQYKAAVEVDSNTGTVSATEFVFQLTDLDTHNEKRDKKMYGWMDTDAYNTIRWVMKSVETVEGKTIGHGEMTMHGVTQSVDIPFQMSMEGTECTISGTADYNYMDFELPKIRLFIFTVNPDLHVHFTLKGNLVSAE
jgi:polyisoprenoid-binding protein YceI